MFPNNNNVDNIHYSLCSSQGGGGVEENERHRSTNNCHKPDQLPQRHDISHLHREVRKA